MVVASDDDWRLDLLNAARDLAGARLRRKAWQALRPGWDHDHCTVCTAKIWDRADTSQGEHLEGYATCEDFVRGADHEWVCAKCFEDFKDRMGWQAVP